MQRQFIYDLEPGRIYVTITPAQEDRERWGDRQVTTLTPFVEVSSKPILKEDGTYNSALPWSFLKIGNYLYRVWDAYRPTTEEEKKIWVRADGPQPWTTSGLNTPYGEGIRQQSGNEVKYDSPVRKKINAVIMRALLNFALEVPDWAERSIALHLEGRWKAACQHEEDLKGQMEAAVGATDKAKAALDAHLSKMEE